MAIQPTQPQSIGGVLDTTFQLYKASLVRVIPLCVLLVIASSPTSIYLLMNTPDATDPLGAFTAMRSLNYWLAYGVGIIASLWVIAAVYLKVDAIGAGGDLSVASALQKGLSRVPHLFLMMILFFIAVTIGCVLLLVPGLILMVSLMLCFNLALFEGKGPVDSLTGSHRLVWGNWWRTAGILTVGFIIVMVIYMVAALLIGVVLPFVGLGDAEDIFLVTLVTGMIVGGLMSLLVTPFYVGLVIAVYWDLKLRKEGGDLAARVGALNPA